MALMCLTLQWMPFWHGLGNYDEGHKRVLCIVLGACGGGRMSKCFFLMLFFARGWGKHDASWALVYVVLFGLSFWQIKELNGKLVDYDEIAQTHELRTLEKNKLEKDLKLILKSLEISKSIKSNKSASFRVLAQIASAVPKRVKFNSVEYNGSSQIIIKGSAFSDQDILKLISNLNNKKLIKQASLATMTLPEGQTNNAPAMKGFVVACILENV